MIEVLRTPVIDLRNKHLTHEVPDDDFIHAGRQKNITTGIDSV